MSTANVHPAPACAANHGLVQALGGLPLGTHLELVRADNVLAADFQRFDACCGVLTVATAEAGPAALVSVGDVLALTLPQSTPLVSLPTCDCNGLTGDGSASSTRSKRSSQRQRQRQRPPQLPAAAVNPGMVRLFRHYLRQGQSGVAVFLANVVRHDQIFDEIVCGVVRLHDALEHSLIDVGAISRVDVPLDVFDYPRTRVSARPGQPACDSQDERAPPPCHPANPGLVHFFNGLRRGTSVRVQARGVMGTFGGDFESAEDGLVSLRAGHQRLIVSICSITLAARLP